QQVLAVGRNRQRVLHEALFPMIQRARLLARGYIEESAVAGDVQNEGFSVRRHGRRTHPHDVEQLAVALKGKGVVRLLIGNPYPARPDGVLEQGPARLDVPAAQVEIVAEGVETASVRGEGQHAAVAMAAV